MNNLTVFLDLDGVLVNLAKAIKEQFDFQFPKERVPDEQFNKMTQDLWSRVHEVDGFWESIPPMPGYANLYNYFEKYSPYILTATPHVYEPYSEETVKCANGKWNWVTNWLSEDQGSRFYATKSHLKQNFMFPGTINVLIDDMEGNIDRWEQEGGIGILYEGSPFHAINEFEERVLNARN